jgi:hypothetical protein
VGDRAFTSGEGPKALFAGAVGWLRERQVLLPGVSTLARLVARVREGATQRVYDILAGQVSAAQAGRLDGILEVPEGARVSLLERWRHGPRAVSGKAMVAALTRTAEIGELGVGRSDLSGVPPRRVIELARYGMAAKAPALRRLPRARRIATLLATARWLEVRAVDEAVELFHVLMSTELLGRSEREANAEKLRRYSLLARHASRLVAAVEVMLETTEDFGEQLPLELVWDAIENVVSRAELRAAVASLSQVLPPPDADPDGEWRARLVERLPRCAGSCRCCAGSSTSARPPRPPRCWPPWRRCPSCSRPARAERSPPGGWTPAASRPSWCPPDGGSDWCSRRTGPRARWPRPPTCSACSSSSTDT